MTELEKRIYNTHLAVSRSLRNKPFKLKNDFSNLEPSKALSLKRLYNFFTRNKDVDMQIYFSAPYKLYTDVQYFDLTYFASLRAVKTYTIYKKQLIETQPDTQLNNVKESLSVVTKFCLDNKINFEDYSTFRASNLEPEWTYHFKHGKINAYTMMEFPNIYSIIQDIPSEEKELLLGNFGTNFLEYRTRYMSSKILRPFLKEAFIKVKLFVDRELNSKKYKV
jgi:hypothetical protein